MEDTIQNTVRLRDLTGVGERVKRQLGQGTGTFGGNRNRPVGGTRSGRSGAGPVDHHRIQTAFGQMIGDRRADNSGADDGNIKFCD